MLCAHNPAVKDYKEKSSSQVLPIWPCYTWKSTVLWKKAVCTFESVDKTPSTLVIKRSEWVLAAMLKH